MRVKADSIARDMRDVAKALRKFEFRSRKDINSYERGVAKIKSSQRLRLAWKEYDLRKPV